jgi:hypothetical protein
LSCSEEAVEHGWFAIPHCNRVSVSLNVERQVLAHHAQTNHSNACSCRHCDLYSQNGSVQASSLEFNLQVVASRRKLKLELGLPAKSKKNRRTAALPPHSAERLRLSENGDRKS